jgi:hypothetical protein
VNAFNKLISTLPVLTTDEEVLGRLLWNAAMEEAAKLAYAEALTFEGSSIRSRPSAALKLVAHKIRAMQTTAGAAATPTKSIGERIADEIWGELDGTWMGSHPVTADKKRKFAAAIDRIIAAKTAGAAGGEGK